VAKRWAAVHGCRVGRCHLQPHTYGGPQTGETPKRADNWPSGKGGGRLFGAKSIITNRQHGASHVRQHQPTAHGLVNSNDDLVRSLPVCSSVSSKSDYKRADRRLFLAVPCPTLSASNSNNAPPENRQIPHVWDDKYTNPQSIYKHMWIRYSAGYLLQQITHQAVRPLVLARPFPL
jgi:hypothetical protein